MTGPKTLLLTILVAATAAVFLAVVWIASGGTIPTGLPLGGSNTAADSAGGEDLTIWAIGDSLMVAAAGELEERSPGIVVDAKVGRRMDQGIDALAGMLDSGTPDVLIVALGTNNGVAVSQIDEVMGLARDVEEVIFVNVSVPRPWESGTNMAISSAVENYPNAAVVDWKTVSEGIEDGFRSDGYHLSRYGTQVWVSLIMAETTS